MTRCPNSECLTSGCHCSPNILRSLFSNAATGVEALLASTSNPAGAFDTESPWLIQVVWSSGWPARSVPPSDDRDRGRAVLAQAGVRDLAAELLRHHLESVADAEHGHAELEDAGIERRRPRLVHARRTTAEHDARGALRGDLGRGDRVRHDLAVDVGLAHAAGDQLRVLRTEVDDQDGVFAAAGGHAVTPSSTRIACAAAISASTSRGTRRSK